MTVANFGRVDADNNVFVVDNGVERKVGQYPNVTAEQALAFYTRKFDDLEAQVRIAEQRVAAKLDVHSLKKNLQKLNAELVEPSVVGDIQNLRSRVEALSAGIGELAEAQQVQSSEQIAAALATRVEIAEKAEAIANQDPAKIQFKNSSAELVQLFNQWQELQKSGPRVPKTEADPIWKRFSTARTKFENAKRAHFAALDATNKQTKSKKLEIVVAAEALVTKGAEAVVEYRKLLDQWKAAGRSNAKSDDQLWNRFKAAGDAIYAAKSEAVAVENVEYSANLKAKQELIDEANKTVKPEENLAQAKKTLQAIQARWEKIGKVPRDKVREIEDKLRAVESKVRKAEEEQWRKSDPATQDRTNSVLSQLEDSIVKLEADLAAAKVKKDAKAVADSTAALDARKAWLEVVKKSQ